MKRLVYYIAVIFLVAGLSLPAVAIDKEKKDETPKDSNKTTENVKQDQSKKNYDDFVDTNKNGIDDRAEKKTTSKPKKENPDPPKKPNP